MEKNMTDGSPIKLILSFAVPLFLGNLLQQTYNMIDAAIVGKILGSNALASVGASSSVQFLVLGFCIGICAGFGVPLAKHYGEQRIDKLHSSIFNAFVLTGFFAVILTGVTVYLCHDILKLLKTPNDIYDGAYSYLFIIFCGIPFSLAYNLLASMLRSVGDSKTPFIFLAVSTILNIFLDLLFIIVLKTGCEGAALATIISQGVSAFLCFIFIRKKSMLLRVDFKKAKLSGRSLWELIYMGVPMGLQYSITAIGSMVMQSANNGLGSVYVSGFAAGSKLKQFAMCPFDAIATGVAVFAGQNLGAGKLKRIKQGLITGISIASLYGLFMGILLILFGGQLSIMFINAEDTEVLAASAKYLGCLGLFFWVLGILNTCRMTIQGLGYSGIAIFSGLIEMAARIIVCQFFVPKYGFDAICFTDQSAWCSAAIYCFIVCILCLKLSQKKLSKT